MDCSRSPLSNYIPIVDGTPSQTRFHSRYSVPSEYVRQPRFELASVTITVRPRNGGIDCPEVARGLQSGIGRLKIRMIEYVERVSAELQDLILRPRHLEILQYRHIQVPETGAASHIAGTCIPAEWKRKRPQSIRFI